MKHRLTWILAAALMAAACSPRVYPLQMVVRQPSTSGLTLVGKNAAIVYMDGANTTDSLFDRHVASALARSLEDSYYDGAEVIPLSHIASPDSVGVDLMHTLVMETGGDLVFLLSSSLGSPSIGTNKAVSRAASPDSAYVAQAEVPVQSSLFVYDSMGKDEVLKYKGNAVLRSQVYNNGIVTDDGLRTLALHALSPEAEVVGERIARRFLSHWKTDDFPFYYFDDYSSEAWFTPLQHVADGKFSAAVDGYSLLVKDGSNLKRSCACFNLAQVFYLLGDYKLSSRWLDEAEKLENVSQAPFLRKRLASHLEK